MNKHMDQWMDRWIDRQMDGWIIQILAFVGTQTVKGKSLEIRCPD